MNKTTKTLLVGAIISTLAGAIGWIFHRGEKSSSVSASTAPNPQTEVAAGPSVEPAPALAPMRPIVRPLPVAASAATSKPKPKPKPSKPQAVKCNANWYQNRRVVIDGTNVCFWRKRERGCISLGDLLAICMDLRRRGVDYKVFFDASTRYRLRDCGEAGDFELYLTLLAEKPDRFCEVKSGESADQAVLKAAAQTVPGEKPAFILTRDNYFEHRARYPFAGDASRRLWGEICPQGFYFRRVNWFVPLGKAA